MGKSQDMPDDSPRYDLTKESRALSALSALDTRIVLAFLIAGIGCHSPGEEKGLSPQDPYADITDKRQEKDEVHSTEVIPGVNIESADFSPEQIYKALQKARTIIPKGKEWWGFVYEGKPVRVVLKKLDGILDGADGVTDFRGIGEMSGAELGLDVKNIPPPPNGTINIYVDDKSMAHELVHLLLGNTSYISSDLNEFIAHMVDGGVSESSGENINIQSTYVPDNIGLVSLPSLDMGAWRRAGIADLHSQRLRIMAGQWASDPKRVQTTMDFLRTFEMAKTPATFDDYTSMIRDGVLPNTNVFRRLREDGHYVTLVRHPRNNKIALQSVVIFGLHDVSTSVGRYSNDVNLYLIDEARSDDRPLLIGAHNFTKKPVAIIQISQVDHLYIQVGEDVNQRIPVPWAGQVSGARFDLAK